MYEALSSHQLTSIGFNLNAACKAGMAFLERCSWNSKNIVLSWSAGDNEIGKEKGTDIIRVKVNPKYYRPTEVEQLLGDPSKAKSTFGWEPKVPFEELVKDMMTSDIELMKKSPNAWFYVLIHLYAPSKNIFMANQKKCLQCLKI